MFEDSTDPGVQEGLSATQTYPGPPVFGHLVDDTADPVCWKVRRPGAAGVIAVGAGQIAAIREVKIG
jgi:hypothetical protein